jgi:hypothetical protein
MIEGIRHSAHSTHSADFAHLAHLGDVAHSTYNAQPETSPHSHGVIAHGEN